MIWIEPYNRCKYALEGDDVRRENISRIVQQAATQLPNEYRLKYYAFAPELNY